jgi:hypothetical protein
MTSGLAAGNRLPRYSFPANIFEHLQQLGRTAELRPLFPPLMVLSELEISCVWKVHAFEDSGRDYRNVSFVEQAHNGGASAFIRWRVHFSDGKEPHFQYVLNETDVKLIRCPHKRQSVITPVYNRHVGAQYAKYDFSSQKLDCADCLHVERLGRRPISAY